MTHRAALRLTVRILFATAFVFPVVPARAQDRVPQKALREPRDVSAFLAPLVKRHDVPGMAAATVTRDGLVAIGAAGVRRRGGEEKVTTADRFHIGSCTKSMTATLAAMLVRDKKIAWDTKLVDVFPERGDRVDEGWKAVRLEHLLTNRSGAPGSLLVGDLWSRLRAHEGPAHEARFLILDTVTSRAPGAAAGEQYVYSNAGFVLAGAMLEKVTGKPWEDLLRERLFVPLHMKSAGFGAPGNRESVTEPRGHVQTGSVVEPGPLADNPAALGPAGTVHCSVGDWAKYVRLHLRGADGDSDLLSKEGFSRLHRPADGAGQTYAMGWIVTERPWAGGVVLTHSGSNTMWYAVVWIAPDKDFAVLAATNQGGPAAAKACDAAVGGLIQGYLKQTAGEVPRRAK